MKIRKGSVYRFQAAGWDIFDKRDNTPADGTLVRVCHPYGCPKPGTMGHCHVEDATSGEFIGLVMCASLHRD